MKAEVVLLVALLTATSGAQVGQSSAALTEGYKVALAGALNHVQMDRGEWEQLALNIARLMDRGEWA
jgi:hypothetical protein